MIYAKSRLKKYEKIIENSHIIVEKTK